MKKGNAVRVKAVYIAEDTQRDVEKYIASIGRVGLVTQVDRGWLSVDIDGDDYVFYQTDRLELLDELLPIVRQALFNLGACRVGDTGTHCLSPEKHQDHFVAFLATGGERICIICTNCLVKMVREAEKT